MSNLDLRLQLGHQIVLWSWRSYLTSFSSYIKWENNSHHRFYHLLGLWEELIIRLRWCLAQNGFGLSFYMCSSTQHRKIRKRLSADQKLTNTQLSKVKVSRSTFSEEIVRLQVLCNNGCFCNNGFLCNNGIFGQALLKTKHAHEHYKGTP